MDRAWIAFYDSFYNKSMSHVIQYHQVQVTLQTDQVTDIPVWVLLFSVVQAAELY
mgnify:FL=1